MKKNSQYILLLLILGLLANNQVLAETTLKIGVVDPEYVLAKYPKAQKSIAELDAKKLKIQEKIRKKTEELNAAKAKPDISKTELQLIAEQSRANIEPELADLEKQARTSSEEVQKEITEAIRKLAESSKYDWILLKSAVLYFKEGVVKDINDEVLQSLTKSTATTSTK